MTKNHTTTGNITNTEAFSFRIPFGDNECVKAAGRKSLQDAVARHLSSRSSGVDRFIASRMQRRDGTSGHAMIRLVSLREQECSKTSSRQ